MRACVRPPLLFVQSKPIKVLFLCLCFPTFFFDVVFFLVWWHVNSYWADPRLAWSAWKKTFYWYSFLKHFRYDCLALLYHVEIWKYLLPSILVHLSRQQQPVHFLYLFNRLLSSVSGDFANLQSDTSREEEEQVLVEHAIAFMTARIVPCPIPKRNLLHLNFLQVKFPPKCCHQSFQAANNKNNFPTRTRPRCSSYARGKKIDSCKKNGFSLQFYNSPSGSD